MTLSLGEKWTVLVGTLAVVIKHDGDAGVSQHASLVVDMDNKEGIEKKDKLAET